MKSNNKTKNTNKKGKSINKNQGDFNIVGKKILPSLNKLNKSSEDLEDQKIGLKTEENEDDQFNLYNSLDMVKKIKQAKELKDLEKIYKKWNQEKVLKSKDKKEMAKLNDYIETEMFQKKKKDNKKKKNELEKQKKLEKDAKNKEKKQKLEKIKEIKKNLEKINSEEEDLEKLEKKMNNEFKILGEKSEIFNKNEYNEKDNQVNFIAKLEYVILLGNYLEKEIKLNREKNLISPEEAINMQDKPYMTILGYFGSEFALNKINTFIEVEPSNEHIRDLTLKVLTYGLATTKIYKLILDDEKYIEMFNDNIEKWFTVIQDLKKKISNIFNISEEKLLFFSQNIFKYEVYLLVYNQTITNLPKILLNKFKVKVITRPLLNNLILSPSIFNINFCKNIEDWPTENLNRGGKKYYPPYDWVGMSLNISDKYDLDNDNIWFGKTNKKGEWPVAYHAIGKENVFYKVLNIINYNLKEGLGQSNKQDSKKEDNKNKSNNFSGELFFSPNIKYVTKYADTITLGDNGMEFKFVIMARVNPEKIKTTGNDNSHKDWILNGNDNEVRPYRLLINIS